VLADAGSIPAVSTNLNVQLFSVGHFSLCKPHTFPFIFNMLRTSQFQAIALIGSIFLSHCHFSLLPCPVSFFEVREMKILFHIKSINYARTNQHGLMKELVGKREHP